MIINETELIATIRSIPDFPKEGILFRDITTLLKNALWVHCSAHSTAFWAILQSS